MDDFDFKMMAPKGLYLLLEKTSTHKERFKAIIQYLSTNSLYVRINGDDEVHQILGPKRYADGDPLPLDEQGYYYQNNKPRRIGENQKRCEVDSHYTNYHKRWEVDSHYTNYSSKYGLDIGNPKFVLDVRRMNTIHKSGWTFVPSSINN